MPETDQEMKERIEKEERMRAEARRRIAAERSPRVSGREEAQIMRLVAVISIILGPTVAVLGVLSAQTFVFWIGAALVVVALGCFIGAWVVGYS